MTDTAHQERLTRLLGYCAQDPRNFALLVDIAMLQLTLGQSADARATAQRAVDVDSTLPQGHALLGLAAHREEDYAAAAAALSEALQRGEQAPEVFYRHAHALALLQRFEEARPSAERAAQFAAEFPYAPALYLRVLHYLGDIEEAIAYAESLQASGVAAPRVNAMLSTLYMDNEDFDKARGAAERALDENADDLEAHTTNALLALGQLDQERALAQFHRILKADPANGRAVLGGGLSHLLAGDLTAAAEWLERAVHTTNMREHIGTWQALAWCYIFSRQTDKAERALNAALELDHSFAETYGAQAVVALQRGDIDAATLAIRRAKGLDEDNFASKVAESLIAALGGRGERAAELMDQLLLQATLPDGRTAQQAIAEMLASNEAGMPTLH